MNCSLANGPYKIFNVKYSGQDADLYGGQPTANIVGYYTNSDSMNMVWNLTNVDILMTQITLRDEAPSANGSYASVDNIYSGAVLQGSLNNTIWTLAPIMGQNPCQYLILAPPNGMSQLGWTLPNGNNGTSITLEKPNCSVNTSLPIGDNGTPITIQSGCNANQTWTFKSVGNMARGINDLD
ncbi:hypothetical protein OG21DRAFT_1521006 [Imleria badia]|nr:hypothetical protein OG21DRAFT_1521006 [Imleria badia]